MTCAITMYMLDRRTACRFDNGLRMIHSRHSPIVCVYMYEACRYLWFFPCVVFVFYEFVKDINAVFNTLNLRENIHSSVPMFWLVFIPPFYSFYYCFNTPFLDKP